MDNIFLFNLAHIFRTQSVLSNSEHYLEIINLLYLIQEPVDLKKYPDPILNFKKKIILLTKFFSILYGIFSSKWVFSYFEIFVKYIYNVIFHSPKSKRKFQIQFQNSKTCSMFGNLFKKIQLE